MSRTAPSDRQTRVMPVAPVASKETHSGDTDHQELSQIIVPELGEGISDEIRENVQPALGAHASGDYMTELAFMEEPVTIRIEPSGEENAPLTVDCWVNGKGAEVERNGRWQELGFLPIGIVVTTKRKYVEVLARSKTMKVSTPEQSANDANPDNNVRRRNVRMHSFSVIKDPSPRGAAWLTQIFNEQF